MTTNPALTIRQLHPAVTIFSVPFLRFNRIKFGGRGTMIKLSSGRLAIFSPTPLTPEVSSTISAAGGNVAYLIAPDIEHHMQLTAYKRAFPSAAVLAPAEIREKRAKAGDEDIVIDHPFPLTSPLPTEFTDDLDVEFFGGHASKEIVLLHKQSRTVIEADVVFNLPAKEQYSKTGEDPSAGIWTKIFTHFGNATGTGKGHARFVWYALAKDKKSFGESVKRVDNWDFDRIVPCHGDVIETGGKDVWRNVFGWFL